MTIAEYKKSQLGRARYVEIITLAFCLLLGLSYWRFVAPRFNPIGPTTTKPPLFASHIMSLEISQYNRLSFLPLNSKSASYTDNDCSSAAATPKAGCPENITSNFDYILTTIPTADLKAIGWHLEISQPGGNGTEPEQRFTQTVSGVQLYLEMDTSSLALTWSGDPLHNAIHNV